MGLSVCFFPTSTKKNGPESQPPLCITPPFRRPGINTLLGAPAACLKQSYCSLTRLGLVSITSNRTVGWEEEKTEAPMVLPHVALSSAESGTSNEQLHEGTSQEPRWCEA
jgi:hypothetical protein